MKKILLCWIPTFALATWLLAVPALAVTISATIPGMTSAATTSTSPGAFVSGFYQFALMIGGVLAFGAIVYGGILYAASAGNPSKQSEGKEWIKSALFGLLLLAGAYLILYTINPNLVNLGLPTLQSVNISSQTSGQTFPGETDLPNGQVCQTTTGVGTNCLPSGNTVQILPNGQVCNQNSSGLQCLPSGTPVILPNGQLCSKVSTGTVCLVSGNP